MFTASHPFYAENAIKLIDPDSKIFSHRLFRANCIQTEQGPYVKDLRILNRDKKSLIIVDNSIVSFAFQLENGVPIIPFYDDRDDDFIIKIKDYLMELKDVDDVREVISCTFSLPQLYTLNVASFLKYYTNEDVDNSSLLSKDSPQTKQNINKNVEAIGCSPTKKSSHQIENEKDCLQEDVNNNLKELQDCLPKYLESHKESV